MPDEGYAPGGETGSTVSTASPAVSPSSSAESSSAATIAPPAEGSLPGPVPYDRFKEVNDRYQRVQWAETHNPQLVQQQAQFFHWLDSDPVGAHTYLTDYLGRMGVLRAPQDAPTRPQPLVVPETGQKFYTAEHVDQLIDQAVSQALDQRIAPLEGSLAEGRARMAAQAQVSAAERLPYFKQHSAEILRAMEADQRLSLEGAYNRVVVPRIRSLERQAILKEINQKSDASTVNPGNTAASDRVPLAKMSLQDLFRRELAKRGQQ